MAVQSSALTGLVMIASSSSTLIAGLAERMSAAMPAAPGVAALVPKKGAKPGTVVLTPSGPARLGFRRTSGAASALPELSKRRVTGPRALKTSGVVGVAQREAATVSAPLADAASGLMALELVG